MKTTIGWIVEHPEKLAQCTECGHIQLLSRDRCIHCLLPAYNFHKSKLILKSNLETLSKYYPSDFKVEV